MSCIKTVFIYISVILEISSLSRILVKIRIENKLFVFIMMQCYWGFDTRNMILCKEDLITYFFVIFVSFS